ncbi:hypothetical protein ACP4OV_025227 [Aristida adscensionis]
MVWAPVLLMHLGGQDIITAYNIEDNELWRRHVLTVVSQVTVAIYVFCKSWPGGDDLRLFQAAVLIFVVGMLKCFEKPWALRSASINSLVSSSGFSQRTANTEGDINSLEDFVREARTFVKNAEQRVSKSLQIQQGSEPVHSKSPKLIEELEPPYKQFADFASPLPERLSILKFFWVLKEGKAYQSLQTGISSAFSFLYTKQEMLLISESDGNSAIWRFVCGFMIRLARTFLPWAAICLFHYSNRHAYNVDDVKITYALLCCTAALELTSSSAQVSKSGWPEMVFQYNLIGVFVHNIKPSNKMRIMSLFGGNGWCMNQCFSSPKITELIFQYMKDGWKEYIKNVATYRRFSSHRGQWTLERHQCNNLVSSLDRPFDESVLLWHIATDFCFYSSAFAGHRCDFDEAKPRYMETKEGLIIRFAWMLQKSSGASQRNQYRCGEYTHCKANLCTRMSNYMMHLLYDNPEMLMPGTRRDLVKAAYKELKGICKGDKLPTEEIGLSKRIIQELKSTQGSQESFIHDAWVLAEALQALGDEKMWKVIEGVWIEMLCFSASRCRGYLHAKALGSGGEFLTYVWLLLSRMGMETLAERMQRPELTNSAPSTFMTRADNNADSSTSEIHVKATSSISEVCTAAEEDMV